MASAPSDAAAIRVSGAREHNLRDVSLTLPKGRLICFTGVSGSGKSSLAFDTIYAEGQRRYIESLSAYARQFLGELPKPAVDHISGLAPSISIQQKTTGWNPRSTVGTITQIHDYLRVLYARAGSPHCPRCGEAIRSRTREQMIAQVLALPAGAPLLLLAPKARRQKGEHRELLADLLNQGFVRARVDGQVIDLTQPPPLDGRRRHDVEVVVDRLTVDPAARGRLAEALDLALAAGDGMALVVPAADEGAPGRRSQAMRRDADEAREGPRAGELLLSSRYSCARCGVGFEPPAPQLFSFNSPQGMCRSCDGLGVRVDFDAGLLIPDPSLSLLAPCVVALRRPPGRWLRHILEGVARHVGADLEAPWESHSARAKRAFLYGTGDAHVRFEWRTRGGVWRHGGTFEGILADLRARYRRSGSSMVRRYYEQFMRQGTCPECKGSRLVPEALGVTLTGTRAGRSGRDSLNIAEACRLSIREALHFFEHLELDATGRQIAIEPLKEICARLRFLIDVGLDYLSLDRSAPSLAGGESQRIRLASQIGCGLTGVVYVLDEPSIGLHPRDNRRLLASLQRLRDLGNTVIVVEHDRDTMEAADHVVDFGPGPGIRGGRVVAQGPLSALAASSESVTGAYLSGRSSIAVPAARRPVRRRA